MGRADNILYILTHRHNDNIIYLGTIVIQAIMSWSMTINLSISVLGSTAVKTSPFINILF